MYARIKYGWKNQRLYKKCFGIFVFFILALSIHANAQDIKKSVANVHKAASDSVVNITSKMMMPNVFNMKIPQKGTGSGFIYDNKGHIVTNYHLVGNASKIMVSLTLQRNLKSFSVDLSREA